MKTFAHPTGTRRSRGVVRRSTASYIARLSGRGTPLPRSVRRHMEPRFGTSFAGVRVHHDREASDSARSLGARAYTFGKDVVFHAGEYNPETAAGRRLIAHELAHVVQQASAGPSAQRVMRSTFPGCDKATTGVADADQRMQDAQTDAGKMLAAAQTRFPKMDTATIAAVDEHFHCPSTSELKTVISTLGGIDLTKTQIGCLGPKDSDCKAGENGRVTPPLANFCPSALSSANRAARFPGLIIDAAAQVAGLKNFCTTGDACYDDFTIPASKMVGNAVSYAAMAVELAGHSLHTGATIPCAPQDTGILADVPPTAASDPNLIREHSGFHRDTDAPLPTGTVIQSVFEDRAGNRFIYSDFMPGARAFTAAEAAKTPEQKRYYFPGGHALQRK